MTIHVNSDKTIKVGAGLKALVEDEVGRVLGRFAESLTRVHVHLSDIDGRKSGRVDKRCLVEVRPAGASPLSASATTATVDAAVRAALGKTRRALSTHFGRKGWASPAPVRKVRQKAKNAGKAHAATTAENAPATKAAAGKARATGATKKAARPAARAPQKKAIFQARRKAWPAR